MMVCYNIVIYINAFIIHKVKLNKNEVKNLNLSTKIN